MNEVPTPHVTPEVEARIERRIQEALADPRSDVLHVPEDEARAAIEEILTHEIDKAVALKETPDDFFCFLIFSDKPSHAGHLDVRVWRNFKNFPMTESEFYDRFKRAPIQDDLDRINCKKAGEIGHQTCGWCGKHGTSRLDCVCWSDHGTVEYRSKK